MSESCFNCKKIPTLIKKTVSLLCVKTKIGAHKQLTFYFQMRKYFCRHLHSSLLYGKRFYSAEPRMNVAKRLFHFLKWTKDIFSSHLQIKAGIGKNSYENLTIIVKVRLSYLLKLASIDVDVLEIRQLNTKMIVRSS